MKKLQLLFKNDFFKGGVFFTASSLFISFLNYLFNFISARILGPRGYSEITTLFSYLSITAIPTWVVSSFIIQKVASSGKRKFEYAFALEELFWRKIKRGWLAIFLLFLFIPFISKFTNLSNLTSFVVIPLILLTFISSFYGATMLGLNLLVLYSLVSILGVVIKLLGPIFIILGFNGFSTIILFLLLSAVLPLILIFISLNSLFKKKVTLPLIKIENKIRSLVYNPQFLLILASTLALILLNNFDIVFVKKFLSAEEAGIYGSWSLFAKIILYAVGPLISIGFIFFSSQKGKNQNVFRISLIFLFIIGLFSYVIYTYFAAFVVNIFFGEKFMAVLPYLGNAAIFGSLYAMLSFINNYYLAKKSKISLVLPILIPIYFLLIFLVKKNISNIISLNIIFALVVLLIHAAIYLKEELNLNSKSS